MLTDVLRFSKDADRLLADPTVAELTLGQLLKREGYGDELHRLVPHPHGRRDLVHAPRRHARLPGPDLPALLRQPRPAARHRQAAVALGKGGARGPTSRRRRRTFSGEVFLGEPAEKLERTATGVRVTTASRSPRLRRRDHGDAPAADARDPRRRDERRPSARSSRRSTTGPTTSCCTPTRRSCRRASARGRRGTGTRTPATSTRRCSCSPTSSTRCRSCPPRRPPSWRRSTATTSPRRDTLLARALASTTRCTRRPPSPRRSGCPTIQGVDRVYFAGAWTRYGFHEDGILSGVRVAEALGATVPWGDQLDESRTRAMPGAPIPCSARRASCSPGEQGRDRAGPRRGCRRRAGARGVNSRLYTGTVTHGATPAEAERLQLRRLLPLPRPRRARRARRVAEAIRSQPQGVLVAVGLRSRPPRRLAAAAVDRRPARARRHRSRGRASVSAHLPARHRLPLLPGLVLVLLPRRRHPPGSARRGPEHLPGPPQLPAAQRRRALLAGTCRPEHAKAFFVSPFIQLEDVRYEFAVSEPGDNARRSRSTTTSTARCCSPPRSRSKHSRSPTRRSRASCWRMGPISARALVLIHWQALKLLAEAGRFVSTHGTTQRGDFVLR